MAFDSVRDRIVVFGGAIPLPGQRAGDRSTYAWNGASWSIVATDGPSARDETAFGFNAADGSVIMVGGRANGPGGRTAPRETWRFDGQRWALVDTLGPEGRSSMQGAFDAARARLVVFGGAVGSGGNQGPLATDTWEWDGAKWTRFDAPGPAGRTGHVMAYDAKAKVVLVHGGVRTADGVALTDTWAWNGERWRLLTMEGPRSIFGAATSAPDGGIVMFGGHTLAGSTDTTWLWDGSAWKSIAAKGPTARTFNAMATDVRRRRVYMLGGMTRGTRNTDFWYLSPEHAWVRIHPSQ
jgi:hypothetical protein